MGFTGPRLKTLASALSGKFEPCSVSVVTTVIISRHFPHVLSKSIALDHSLLLHV